MVSEQVTCSFFFGNPKNLRFLCSLSDSGAARPLGIFFQTIRHRRWSSRTSSAHQALPVTISASSRTVSAHQASPVTNSASRNHYQSASSPRGGSAISDLLAADLGSRISDLSPNHCSDLAGSLYRISDLLTADLGSQISLRTTARISPVLSIGSRISSRRISDLLAADLGSRISDLSPNHW